MGIKVGICDDDRLYMQRLMAYANDVKKHGDSGFLFYGYTSFEQLKCSAQEREIDIALVPFKMRDEFSEVKLPVCFLTEEKSGDGVFKYVRADLIISELKKRMHREKPATVKGNTTVIGVCSPLGRSGKTRLAKGICECVEGSLYIAFGDYQTPGSEEERMLCDRILFMVAARDENFYPLIGTGGKELFKGAEHMELRQLGAGDVEFLVSVLREHGDYSYVVFDIGTGAMSDLKILLSCDSILIPTLKDEYACERLDVFKKQLACGSLNALNPRIRYMEVPEDDTALVSRIRREFS